MLLENWSLTTTISITYNLTRRRQSNNFYVPIGFPYICSIIPNIASFPTSSLIVLLRRCCSLSSSCSYSHVLCDSPLPPCLIFQIPLCCNMSRALGVDCATILNLLMTQFLAGVSSQFCHFCTIKFLTEKNILCHAREAGFLKFLQVMLSKGW